MTAVEENHSAPPRPVAMATPVPQLRRRVIDLAAPVIGENLLQTMLGIVDTILVAGLGAVALAGVGTALQVIFVLIAALSALSVGASVLVAQAVGAQDRVAAGRVARQALIWSILIAVPMSGLGVVLTPFIVSLFGVQADVAQVAIDYLHVTMATVTALVLMLIGSGVLRGAGDSRTPMWITAFANVINVVLTWALIYGHLGLPALGAVGSAWATFLARLVGALVLVWVLWQGRNGVSISNPPGVPVRPGRAWLAVWRPRLPDARRILHIGWPAAFEEVLIIAGIATLTPIVATLGTIDLAAHRVVINVLSLSFLPGLGFGLAATALVGQCIGAGHYADARTVTAIACRWALIWMGALGLVFLIFAPQLMRLFTAEQQMIDNGAAAIRIVALTQPFWAATFVYGGALRGTGNTRTPLIITGSIIWVTVGLSFLIVFLVQRSLAAIWAAFLITGPIEVAFYWWVWRQFDRQ